MTMMIGDVRVPDDTDIQAFKYLADANNIDGWDQVYSKNGTKVWTKPNEHSSMNIIRVYCKFTNISAALLYDVLHDSEYRKLWDHSMIEGYEYCQINPNNDITYYSMKCPNPLRNRDFVMQRSWLETPTEFLIFNHSVYHEKLKSKKNYIRGLSYITGYLIKPIGDTACELHYVTHSDPKGALPKWIVNKVTQIVAPKMIKRLYKSCLKYDKWKGKHSPNYKPWLYPEQINLPRVDLSETRQNEQQLCGSVEELDESMILEEDFDTKDLEKHLDMD